jgi:OFA family oxalate/formate antiporter-like MFS transporter
MPPLATWLIVRLEWRDAYLVLGVLAISLGVAAALAMADDQPPGASIPMACAPMRICP